MADTALTDTATTKLDEAVSAVAQPVEAAAETVVAKAETAAKAVAKPVRKAVRTAKAKVAKTKSVRRARKATKRAVTSMNQAAASVADTTKDFTMTYDFTKLFAGYQLPGTEGAQALFADASDKGQAFVAKGRKAAEEMGALAKANVEAVVEAGRIAATGAKALGEDVVASGRDGFEQASEGFKTLAGAASLTDYMQLQGEFARAQFDRLVAEGSKLTERMVKLGGEAMQPIQARASVNAAAVKELLA